VAGSGQWDLFRRRQFATLLTCRNPNTAPFCSGMQVSEGTVPMYGGTFGLISTFSPRWPRTQGNQVCLPVTGLP
jgi:hypothetical protein